MRSSASGGNPAFDTGLSSPRTAAGAHVASSSAKAAAALVQENARADRAGVEDILEILVPEPDAAVGDALAEQRLEDRAVDDVAVAHVEAVVAEREVVDAVAAVLRRQVALFDERPVRLDPDRVLLLAQDLELA